MSPIELAILGYIAEKKFKGPNTNKRFVGCKGHLSKMQPYKESVFCIYSIDYIVKDKKII